MLSPLIARVQRSRLLRGSAHRGTMLLGARFPERFPMVFVLGFPKSGTTWASQLVADYLCLPFPRFALLPHTFASVVHGHEVPTPRHAPLAYVVRDGRDVAVSMFHFELAKLRPDEPRPVARQLRPVFPRTPPEPEEAPRYFPGFLEVFLDDPPSSRLPWHEHVRAFLHRKSARQGMLRYERLLDDGPNELARCLRDLIEREPERDRVAWALEKHAFGRSAPMEHASAPRRAGRAGDWRRHLDRDSARLFHDRAGDLLIELGYEDDASWIDRLGSAPDPADAGAPSPSRPTDESPIEAPAQRARP